MGDLYGLEAIFKESSSFLLLLSLTTVLLPSLLLLLSLLLLRLLLLLLLLAQLPSVYGKCLISLFLYIIGFHAAPAAASSAAEVAGLLVRALGQCLQTCYGLSAATGSRVQVSQDMPYAHMYRKWLCRTTSGHWGRRLP